jgi:hypothetical protein
MGWLFGQVWLLCLVAFVLGLVIGWFLAKWFYRPTPVVLAEEPEAAAAEAAEETPAAETAEAVEADTAAETVAAEGEPAEEPAPAALKAEEPVTSKITPAPVAEDPALSVLDQDTPTAALTPAQIDPPTSPIPVATPEAIAAEPATIVTTPDAEADADTVVVPSALIDSKPTKSEPTPAVDPEPVAAAKPEPELVVTGVAAGPYGPGSAKPLSDGSAPASDYTIKGNAQSKLYHTTDSPYYKRTKAEAWFNAEEAAVAAGFTPWHRGKKKN